MKRFWASAGPCARFSTASGTRASPEVLVMSGSSTRCRFAAMNWRSGTSFSPEKEPSDAVSVNHSGQTWVILSACETSESKLFGSQLTVKASRIWLDGLTGCVFGAANWFCTASRRCFPAPVW